MEDLRIVALVFAPLFVGLAFHGVVMKFGWFSVLCIPIDRGARFRGRHLFGPNKTLRGVVSVAVGCAGAFVVLSVAGALDSLPLHPMPEPSMFMFGLALGGAAMLAELPNSFLKRQVGIGPGSPGRGPMAPVFYVLDQIDFLLGAWLVAWWWVPVTLSRIFWSVLFVLIAHQLISVAGARLGMRETAR